MIDKIVINNKKSLFLILFLILIILLPNYAISSNQEDINDIAEVDSTLFVNVTVINRYQAKVELKHYYSFNKTYLNHHPELDESYSKNIPLGLSMKLDHGKFIRLNETDAITSFGNLEIIKINETELITEKINSTINLKESVYDKVTFYQTGFMWGLENLKVFKIPISFNLINKNISNQKIKVKVTLPYKSKISENEEKYISFFGYYLEDNQILDEGLMDRMISKEPLQILYSRNQVGTNLSIQLFIDYYLSDIPNIILKYSHEYQLLNNRLKEKISMRNDNNYSLYFVKQNDGSGAFYSLVNESELSNFDESRIIRPTIGSYEDFEFNQDDLNLKIEDKSFFQWGKSSFPFESYEINDIKKWRISFRSIETISFFIKFKLEFKKMDLFDYDIENSYYKLAPTKVSIPPIFNKNFTEIYPGGVVSITDFDETVNGARLILNVIPSEYNEDINKTVYRLYSNWFKAEINPIQNASYEDFIRFHDSDFIISPPLNEISVYYHILYSNQLNLKLIWFLYLISCPIIIFATPVYSNRRKKDRYLSSTAVALGLFISHIPFRPYGFTITLFDFIGIEIILLIISYFIYCKFAIKHCPICNKSSKVYKRKKKLPKFVCYRCQHEFD